MWAVILLGLLVGATASEPQNFWKPRTEYLYNITGLSITGINQLANQWAGVVRNITLAAKLRTPDHLQIEIRNAIGSRIHANLSGGFENPIPDDLLNWAPLPLSKKPFELIYQNGKIVDLKYDPSLSNAEVNQLKGIASLFQINMNDDLGSESYEYEETVSGDCKTQYTRTPLPKYLLQEQNNLLQPRFLDIGSIVDVTKQTNFTKCRKSLIYSFGSNQRPLGSGIADSLSHSSNSRAILVNVSGSYILGSSRTTEKVVISPFLYRQQKAMVASRMTALLTNFYPSRNIPGPEPSRSAGGLVYKFNKAGQKPKLSAQDDEYEPSQEESNESSASNEEQEEYARRRRAAGQSGSQESQFLPQPSLKNAPSHPYDALFVGVQGSSVQYHPRINTSALVLNYSREIGEALYKPNYIPQQQSLSQYILLINLIQTFNASDLNRIADELHDEQSSTDPASQYAWETFVNAVSQAGTGPALNTTIYIVKNDMLRGQAAADAVAYIPRAARTPDQKYLDAFFNFAKYDVKDKYPVNNTAILAFTELVYLSQVSNVSQYRYPASAYSDLLGDINHEYLRYLNRKLHQAVVQGYSPNIHLYIRAIGNIGHPDILLIFKPFLEGRKHISTFQRFMMVMVLDKIAEAYPESLQPVALQIVQNAAEAHEIRCAAALLLMASNPSLAVVQNLAQITNSEQNSQVRSALKSIIQSAVQLQKPMDAELARAANAAVNLLTTEEFGYDKTLGNVRSYVVEKLGLAYSQWLKLIGSMDSSVHSTVSFTLDKSHGQLLSHRQEVTSMVSSVQLLMRVLLNQTTDGASPVKTFLKVDRNVSEPLEGNILLDTLASKSFVAFDNNTIAVLKQAIMSEIQRIEAGETFNKTILVNSAVFGVGFPTILGLPATIRFNAPVAIVLRVKAELDVSPDVPLLSKRFFEKVEAVNVSSKISVVYSSQVNSKINIIEPLSRKVYESSLVQNVQSYLPIKLDISYDFENNVTMIKAQPANKNKKYQLYHISRVPTTAVWSLEPLLGYKEDRRIVHVRPTTNWRHVFGPKSTGMAFEIRYQSEAEFDDRKAEADRAVSHDALSMAYFPFASEKVYYYNHSLFYSPEQSLAKSVTIRIRAAKLNLPKSAPNGQSYSVAEESEEDDDDDESYRAKRSPKFGPKRSAESSDEQLYGQVVAALKKSKPSYSELEKKPLEKALPQPLIAIQQRAVVYILDLEAEFEQPKGGKYRLALLHARNSIRSITLSAAYLKSMPVNRDNFQALAIALGLFPLMPEMNYRKALVASPNSNVTIIYNSLNSTKHEGLIVAQLQARRSQSFKEYLKNSAVAKQCLEQMDQEDHIQYACRNATEQAGYLDEFELIGAYSNLSSEALNISYKLLSTIRQQLYPFVSERVNLTSSHPLSSGRFNATLKFSPRWHAFNATANVPTISINFTNVRGWAPGSITPLHPSRHVAERVLNVYQRSQILPACALDKNNLTTFDNLTIPLTLVPRLWTTVLTYAPKPTWHNEFIYANVSLLVRPSPQGGREIQIRAGEETIEQVTPSFIVVNHKKYDLHTTDLTVVSVGNQVLVEGAKLPGDSSWITLPNYGLQVYFDGKRVLVRANDTFRDAVRGICGTYDGEVTTDMTVPQNCIVGNPLIFLGSYGPLHSKSEDVQQDVPRLPRPKYCYPYEIIPGNYIQAGRIVPAPVGEDKGSNEESTQSEESRSSDSSEESEEEPQLKSLKSKVRPVPATRAVEHRGRYAFSVERVLTCLPPLRPREVKLQPVPFHSVKKSPASKHWFEAVLKSPLSYDFSNKKVDVTIEVKVHLSCKAH